MKIFLGSNGYGKTESLVAQSIKTGATIVCFDQMEKNRLISNYGKDLPKPITFEEFTNDRFISGRRFKGILLDIEGVSINCDPSDITILKEPPYKNKPECPEIKVSGHRDILDYINKKTNLY